MTSVEVGNVSIIAASCVTQGGFGRGMEMEFRNRTLTDVHDHSLAVSGWEQTYRQLSPGRFEGSLLQAQTADFLLFKESTNRRLAQSGRSPDSFSSIALPIDRLANCTFQGCHVDGYALLLLGGAMDFRFYTPESLHYLGVSIPSLRMKTLVAAILGDRAVELLDRSVLPVSMDVGERVGAGLSYFVRAHGEQPHVLANPAAGKRFQDEILSTVIDLFNPNSPGNRDVTHATYAEIVHRSEQLVQEGAEQQPTVLDLCVALRCSRRTLQTSFRRVANVSPVEYLRSVRLNGVRRLLRSTSSEELTVGDAAARWGLTHPSYFAREYRDLFGELPSQTPRKH